MIVSTYGLRISLLTSVDN